MIVSCMAMGQAAGAAAAMAASSGIDVAETSSAVLRDALIADGVNLTQLVSA